MARLFIFFLVSFSFISVNDCGDIPEMNKSVVSFAEKKLKKKVGRGECWDLIQYALNQSGAKWDGFNEFGKRIKRKKECLFPGDIIQFERVKIKYTEGNMTYEESMYHHTAIIAEVISQNEVVLLHQNTGQHGRRVGRSILRFDTVKSGQMLFFRPVKNE